MRYFSEKEIERTCKPTRTLNMRVNKLLKILWAVSPCVFPYSFTLYHTTKWKVHDKKQLLACSWCHKSGLHLIWI